MVIINLGTMPEVVFTSKQNKDFTDILKKNNNLSSILFMTYEMEIVK